MPKGSTLAATLLRPFIDLEPCRRGPLYARGLEQYWLAFVDTQRPRFVLQRTLPGPFRAKFLVETKLLEYQANDPRDIPRTLWNMRWRAMCEAVDAWPALTADCQCRLVLLLHALCFYPLIVALIPDRWEALPIVDADDAELAYWRASARYLLRLPDQVANYGDADLSEFQRIVATAPSHAPAAFNAALKILTHKAKVGAPVDELLAWSACAERLLDTVGAKTDDLTRTILSSRFYRGAAFIPQRRGDRRGVVDVMALAERDARAIVPIGEAQELLYLENLHPLLESRTKEALWLGDLDLGLQRALAVLEVDPYDSRAWLEVGQIRLYREEPALAAEAYAAAATLGHPSTAIARHMAGLCFRNLGQPLLAAFFFEAALAVDPCATSPHEEIHSLPDIPVLTPLKEWSLSSFEL